MMMMIMMMSNHGPRSSSWRLGLSRRCTNLSPCKLYVVFSWLKAPFLYPTHTRVAQHLAKALGEHTLIPLRANFMWSFHFQRDRSSHLSLEEGHEIFTHSSWNSRSVGHRQSLMINLLMLIATKKQPDNSSCYVVGKSICRNGVSQNIVEQLSFKRFVKLFLIQKFVKCIKGPDNTFKSNLEALMG